MIKGFIPTSAIQVGISPFRSDSVVCGKPLLLYHRSGPFPVKEHQVGLSFFEGALFGRFERQTTRKTTIFWGSPKKDTPNWFKHILPGLVVFWVCSHGVFSTKACSLSGGRPVHCRRCSAGDQVIDAASACGRLCISSASAEVILDILGPPGRCPCTVSFFAGVGSPTKIGYRKKLVPFF